MEPLIRAAGAEVFPWKMGGRCCGASHMSTQREVGTALVVGILQAARGADAVVTVCPMCQMNLEAFQDLAGRAADQNLHISVLYLPQLIGLALGLDAASLGLQMNLSFDAALKRRVTVAA
jgi:heterodisulfide reductase subunit B